MNESEDSHSVYDRVLVVLCCVSALNQSPLDLRKGRCAHRVHDRMLEEGRLFQSCCDMLQRHVQAQAHCLGEGVLRALQYACVDQRCAQLEHLTTTAQVEAFVRFL